ncbi:glucose-6-phosphate dehydrogenase [Paralcaligenes sp. KSB-10]|jgi:glucose-6-phosphate 1-dehydrogenase|uniref:glucose-6-phosphate dehydrogenase n=1 Tax=Paralcaligenes sp. KSB-10 TaxID=2901142 RepID=UPI001E5FDF39|nr:glucose-6-phosphate dehydrogenase [Paralcaligenes sp. KSB-10]UHL66041.1 glucose-6-phosphate dehydrogenase [Paralcaligenes sp. KSB-10]
MASTPAFDMIFFGGTGDLTLRKLLPALYSAHKAGALHHDGRIFALGRQALEQDGYLALLNERVKPRLGAEFDSGIWASFIKRIHFLMLEADKAGDYVNLAEALGRAGERTTVCYLATAPHLFTNICRQLAAAGLNHPGVRVVLEKPLGHDLESSNAINAAVGQCFTENQIYRIDHYLGKESVQNLMAIRFGNALFEPLWRREWIDNVQITIAEELGVEERGEFYDRTGALRDMLQSHLLQLLCIVAMEPPASLAEDAVRDEKLKVLKALKPFTPEDILAKTVRGQYRSGAINGMPVVAYRDEHKVDPHSNTETFVALQAEIANWRWAGVPFFLRTGKRMQERIAEIVINFRDVPHAVFPMPVDLHSANRLVIHLQPKESIRLYFLAKEPGDAMNLQSTYLNLDFHTMFKARWADAYERLLLDVIRGRLALFMRRDEQAQAWTWVEPIIDSWEHSTIAPKTYTAGSWGPPASSGLLSRAGVVWHEET